MKTQKIKVTTHNQTTEVTVKYDIKKSIMMFSEADNFKKTYHGDDIYTCLAKIRADFPHINFLCKGAKINVKPSRMSSQMSAGLVAYEMTLGKPASRDDIVNIFEFEESDLTNNPSEQIAFFKKWLASINAQEYEKFN